MYRFSFSTIFLLVSFNCIGQGRSPITILEDQVKAFNDADIQRLVENISDDFKWYYIGKDTLMLEVSGKDQFQKSMESYFASISDVRSEILEYTVYANRISFTEKVEYSSSDGDLKSASAMGIYEMKDGLIYRAWYFY